MTVQELISQLRTDLNDTQAVEFSDEELITKINSALRWLSLELASLGTSITLTMTTLTVKDGKATLPSDFISETSVIADGQRYFSGNAASPNLSDRRAYLIVGNQLLINLPDGTTITIYYHRAFPPVSSLSEQLPIPDYLADIVREYVLLTARRRIDLPFPTDLLNDLRVKVRQLVYVNTPNPDIQAPFRITRGFTWW